MLLANERLDHGAVHGGEGIERHCCRVAAWCDVIASRENLSHTERRVLHSAARLHHQHVELSRGGSAEKLLLDLGISQVPERGRAPASPAADVAAVVHGMNSGRVPKQASHLRRLMEILELANTVDESLELLPYGDRGIDEIVSELRELKPADSWRSLVDTLQQLRRINVSAFVAELDRLPVFGAVARRLQRLMLGADVDIGQLEEVATSDPVLAGRVIQTANSALYGPKKRLATIRRALAFIGVEPARRLLAALSLGPLFASAASKALWQHSIEAAELAERQSRFVAGIDEHEAFLAGLVHDIGRLCLMSMPGRLTEDYHALIEQGCEQTAVEMLVCGFDHGHAGAEALNRWRFPTQLVEAVRYHHAPEGGESPIASLLYLTEFWSHSCEDLPSTFRLLRAAQATGLSLEGLDTRNLSWSNTIGGVLAAA